MLNLLNRRQLKKEKSISVQKNKIKTCSINWKVYFSVQYLRYIVAIKKHVDSIYGNIEVGHYINSSQYNTDSNYKHGDLFVVCELDASNRFIYNLVQVNTNADSGFEIIDSVPASDVYPYHENILVATLLKNNGLLAQVDLID